VEEELRRNFVDVSVTLIEGSGGIFDVAWEGEIIFSKNRADCGSRFPDEGEITGLIRDRQKP